jgi:UDP:flavonoid glycosyltransferase YjiC (YdhE family)
MTAKIVLATFGSHGDIHPFIALGKVLRTRGFSVVVASSGQYRPLFEREGLAFVAVGPDEEEVVRRLGVSPREFVRTMLSDHFFIFKIMQDLLAETVRDLMPVVAGADLLVYHHIAYAAQLAAEKQRIPFVQVVLSPVLLMAPDDPPRMSTPPLGDAPFTYEPDRRGVVWNRMLAATFRAATWPLVWRAWRLRVKMGLSWSRALPFIEPGAARAALWLFSPLLTQGATAEKALGATFHDGAAVAPLDPKIEAFLQAGPPPVVLTLGSFAALEGGDLLRAGIAAARALNRRALVIAGRDDARFIRAPRGEDLLVWGYAPHSTVFSRAAAVLHHGGAGTCVQALRAGKPQLVAPFFADQPDNAARVARLGVARGLPRAKFNRESAEEALRDLLENPEYASRVAEAARLIADEDGARAAADVIAKVLDERQTPPVKAGGEKRQRWAVQLSS